MPPGDGVPPPLLHRRRDRPGRLPAPRSQRAGRGRVHAAADGRANRPRSRACASSTPQRLVGGGRHQRGRGRRRLAAKVAAGAQGRARAAQGDLRRGRAGGRLRRPDPRRRPARRHHRRRRRSRLRALNDELLAVPDGFTVNPKLARQLERRRTTLDEGGIDWGQAEELAFASLLVDGIPVRLTGQDTERGTFSHRHLVLHDAGTGEAYTPLQNLDDAAASFEVHNSPLSEFACRRLRVRLLGRRAGVARLLGGPVRRLRQRRAGRASTSSSSRASSKWGQTSR